MYLIGNPNGVDVPIQRLQITFDSLLYPDANTAIYGRAFHNERDKGVVPEVYIGGDYKEVLFDDRYDITVFFDVSPKVEFLPAGQGSAEVGIVVFCNLKKLYPTGGRHATEDVERTVIDMIERYSEFRPLSITKGFDAVSMFAGEKVRFDMQPHYVFRVTAKVNYLYNDCL